MGRSSFLARQAVKSLNKKNSAKKIFQIAVNHSDNVKRSIGADIVFSVNKKILQRTVELGQKEDRTFVIPNAINLSDAYEALPQANLKTKEKIIIGTIGRLDRTKGFDLAIKALKNLAQISDQKFILKIAGSGYFEPNLRALAKKLNLENQVEFLGWIKNKKEFFDSIDIFCLPSKNESFGIVILEAMKFMKPIIATNADGPQEILRHEFDALMVDLNSEKKVEEQLAQSVLRIINEENLADKLVNNAAKKLRLRYSNQALEDRMADIFGKNPAQKNPF
jgi:glycosyltransferase involved in cell wall biosynthesis